MRPLSSELAAGASSAPPAGRTVSIRGTRSQITTTTTTTTATRRRPGGRGLDLAVAVTAVAGAVYVMAGLWAGPDTRGLTNNGPDQVFFEWLLRYLAYAVTRGTNPYFTPLLNVPDGVNIADNTAMTLYGVLLTPVTLVFGASVSFVTALTMNLAGTAYAWYWLFSRHLARSRVAAVAGGLFCGFAPAMVSHANGHLNFTAGFVLPVLLLRLARLTPPAIRRRDLAWLAALIVVQYTLGAELLFITTVGLGVYSVAWLFGWWGEQRRRGLAPSVRRRALFRIVRRVGRRLGVAGGIAAMVLAYPVYMQFFGEQAYHGSGFASIGVWENLASFAAYPHASLAGVVGLSSHLAFNYGEENSYFGPLLLIVAVIGAARWFRRRRITHRVIAMRALSIAGAALALVSMGPRLEIGDSRTVISLPWAILQNLPLFDSALSGRFALLVTPIVAVTAMALTDDLRRSWRRSSGRRVVAALIAVGAFLPLLPVPLPTTPRAPLPKFITSGDWRPYLRPGTTMVSIPPSRWTYPDGQRWQTVAGLAFPMEGGYFLGPGPDGRSTIGPKMRPTEALLNMVASTGMLLPVTEIDRARARVDLAYWHAGLLVMPDPTPGQGHEWLPHAAPLLTTAMSLFGAPRHVDDVWVWVVPPAAAVEGPSG